MSSKEKIKGEIKKCIADTAPILLFLQDKLMKELSKDFSFGHKYQSWYSKAIKILGFLAKDRLQEFKSYYEIDPKRKTFWYGSYYIQDYLKGVAPSMWDNPEIDIKAETLKNVYNQYTILASVYERIDTSLSDMEATMFAELQDLELETAKNLQKINLRAAGVIARVILESYLSKVVSNHGLTISKRNPTLSDFNETLKNNNIYDTTAWRKISYLGDVRNICAHKKDVEPTKDQVEDLISGVHWTTKNIF